MDTPRTARDRIDLGLNFQAAWNLTTEHSRPLVPMAIICLGLAMFIGLIGGLVGAAQPMLKLPFNLLGSLFNLYMHFVFAGTCLRILKGQAVAVGDIVEPGPGFFTYLGAAVMGSVPVILAMVLGGLPLLAALWPKSPYFGFLPTWLLLLWAVPLVLAGLYFSLRLTMLSVFAVLEQDRKDALEALGASWRASQGHVADLFLVLMTVLASVVVGVLLCCVGMLFAQPLGVMLMAVTYKALASGRVGPAAATVAAQTLPGSAPAKEHASPPPEPRVRPRGAVKRAVKRRMAGEPATKKKAAPKRPAKPRKKAGK